MDDLVETLENSFTYFARYTRLEALNDCDERKSLLSNVQFVFTLCF